MTGYPRLHYFRTCLAICFLVVVALAVTQAAATTVSIADFTYEPDECVTAPVLISNVQNYGAGTISISFNSSVVHVIDVSSGPYSTVVAWNPDNISGTVITSAWNITGTSGDIIFANVTFLAMETGCTPLNLTVTTLKDISQYDIPAILDNGSFVTEAEPQHFLISGHVFYENGSECNKPSVNLTNMNTGDVWQAETNASSNYYLLVLNSTDVSVNHVLQFNASGGLQSKTVTHTVTQPDIDAGGIFGFDFTLEASQEFIWQGGVTLINGTTFNVTAHNSGDSYEIDQTTALGALDAAAEIGEFNYSVSDEWYASFGSLVVDSIADIPNKGWDCWMYWVNYPDESTPDVGINLYTLEDGDVVTLYWSSSMEMTPDESSMLVIINVTVEPGPDLTVTAIETPARLRADVVNPITAAVENLGSADATSFDVTLEADGTVVDTVSIAALNASENTTVGFLWTPTATGNCTLNVTADANGAIEENDETNNSLTEDVTVLEKLTATVNVRIEGQNDTVWTGTVTFSNSTVTTTDGATHYLNEPTALGALDEADKIAGFGYVLVDYSWGLYVEEVADEPAIGWDGWMYRVDYTSPWVGADVYTLYGGENVLWYFGVWTAPPLKIELEKTVVNVSEDFIATVTAYNGTSGLFEPVDNATVFVDGLTFQTGSNGNATLSIGTAGDYSVYAEKGMWADYTRSVKKAVTVVSSSVESYGESVYRKKNVRLAWRALGEQDNSGAVLLRKARIAIELEEVVPGCKDVSVLVRKLGFWPASFDIYVSSDGNSWEKIGSENCIFPQWMQYDFSGEFGDVQYIKIKKPGTWRKPKFMGLDAVYAKN